MTQFYPSQPCLEEGNQDIAFESGEWVGSLKLNPVGRIYKPTQGGTGAALVSMRGHPKYPDRPFGWHVRVSVDGINAPSEEGDRLVWGTPLKARILAQGGCLRSAIYFDIAAGAYTWIAPFSSVVVQLLESVDGRLEDTTSQLIYGSISNYPSSTGDSRLRWTDNEVTDDNPVVVRPYCKSITVLSDSDSVVVEFQGILGNAQSVTVDVGDIVPVPGWAIALGAEEPVTIIQHIVPTD